MPPVETSSKPARTRPLANADQASLVRDGQQGATWRRQGLVRSLEIDDDVTPIWPDGEGAREQERHSPWQEAVLDGWIRACRRLVVVVGQDRDRLLRDDRSAVERGIDEMDRAAGHGHAVGQGIRHGMGAGEGRQQRRMGVDDPSRESGQHRGADDPHVTGKHDDVGGDGASSVAASAASSPPGHERGLDPLLRRPLERRAGAIGEDEDDLAAELAAIGGCRQRPQVRAGTRDADGDPAAHAGTAEGRLEIASAAEGVRVGDLTDEGRLQAVLRQSRDRCRHGLTRQDGDHADPAVERGAQLVVVHPAERPDQAHHRRHHPARWIEARAQSFGQRARHVAGQSAAGDVGEAVEVPAARDQLLAQSQHGPGVDPGRGQQHLAERGHRLVRGRSQSRRPWPRRRACGAGAPGTARRGRGPIGRSARGPANSRSSAGRTTPGP